MVKPFGKNIVHETYIAAAPEQVYDTITSARDWDAFFTRGMELEPHPEGKIVWRWKDWGPRGYTADAPGKVLKAEKPKLFAFEWYPVGPEFPTTVAFALARKGDGTVIHLEESGYPDSAEGREMILECASGWAEALTLLKFHIEHGITYHSAKTRDR